MKIDLSLGDPILPFKALIRRAFRDAQKTAHTYEFPNQFLHPLEALFAWEILGDMTAYFTSRGLHEKGWSGLGFRNIYLTAGGTTGAYESVIRILAEDVQKQNTEKKAKIKPVILMPVPSYGFFFAQPERHGIEVVKIPRDLSRGGFLDPRLVHQAILKVNSEGKRVVAYYDQTPHNPLGFVRSREETEKIAMLLRHHSDEYREEDFARFKTTILPWSGPASRIRVIDDLIYDGLTYDGEPVFSFAHVPEMFQDTFVLAGVSKSGFVNGRAGVVIAHDHDIEKIHYLHRATNYLAPMIGVWALHHFFNDKAAQKSEREAYQAKVREIYRFNGVFMKALINGLPHMEAVEEHDTKRMENLLMRHSRMARQEAKARLNRGIARVKVITTPKAGFFHLLDFSALKGMQYPLIYTRRSYGDDPIVKDEGDIEDVMNKNGLNMASGQWCGLPNDTIICRVTFALSPKAIIEACAKLENAMKIFQPAAAPSSTRQLIPA